MPTSPASQMATSSPSPSATLPTAERKSEIRRLLRLSPEEVRRRAGDHLVVFDDLGALHRGLAEEMAGEIVRNNQAGCPTRLILPVGPVGQYPILANAIRSGRISLGNCHLFFMDEYCQEGKTLPPDHPLSFKGIAHRALLDRLAPDLAPPAKQVVFPDESNIAELAARIEEIGGIDTCYGGIGIHGHLAFNEPEVGVAETGPRLVQLNEYTVTINAIRAQVGGNLACFPRAAFTLGMRQILGAQRIVLTCRNGAPYDWANTVLRLALFGEPGDDYPVTHVRDQDYTILTDVETLASPRRIL